MAVTDQNRRESLDKLDRKRMYDLIIAALHDNQEQGLTARETAVILYNQGMIISNERQATQPRFTELVDEGVVKVIGKRRDEITNRNVAVYALNN